MAKTGFPFYRAETDRFQDIRIKRLKKEFKGAGYAVYSYILNEIYRVKGCFLEWDESTAFDVSEYWDLKESQVEEIVKYCCAIGLFDKGLFIFEGGRGNSKNFFISEAGMALCSGLSDLGITIFGQGFVFIWISPRS